MFPNLKKTFIMVGSTALLLGACGDDGGGGGAVDAAPIDAASPDAMPDTTFIGTVSLGEVTVTNPEGVAANTSGAAAVVSFTSPANIIAPDPDFDNNVGECKVTIIDIAGGDAEQDSDGGAVSVTGTLAGDFNCAYNATLDTYLCSSTDAAAAGAMPVDTVLSPDNGNVVTMTLTIPGADFSGLDYRGMNVILSGFPDDAGNGRFQVLGDDDGEELSLLNSQGLQGDTTLVTASTYQTIVGGGPIIGGYDFLDDGTNDVVITKAEATDAPALNTTLKANGSGFSLSDESELPHAFPASGDATFSCDGTNGDCGTALGTLQGLIVFGETTDGALTTGPLASFAEMPDPEAKFARFQCSGIGQQSMTIPAAAVALINGTGHTRIQTSVTYANAQIAGKTNVVVAHGVVGFTDAP